MFKQLLIDEFKKVTIESFANELKENDGYLYPNSIFVANEDEFVFRYANALRQGYVLNYKDVPEYQPLIDKFKEFTKENSVIESVEPFMAVLENNGSAGSLNTIATLKGNEDNNFTGTVKIAYFRINWGLWAYQDTLNIGREEAPLNLFSDDDDGFLNLFGNTFDSYTKTSTVDGVSTWDCTILPTNRCACYIPIFDSGNFDNTYTIKTGITNFKVYTTKASVTNSVPTATVVGEEFLRRFK